MDRYLFPATLAEALETLARYDGKARVIAGGTDLVLALEKSDALPTALVDITRLAELGRLERQGGDIYLGAAVTHAACASSSLIRETARCLAEACSSVGSPQIRQVGTVVGNLVNAQPAADAAVALVALGAVVDVVSAQGKRQEQVENLCAGVGRSRIDSTREIVTGVRFAATKPGQASAFLRFSPRKAMALPILNGAVWVSLQGEKVADVRIALGPVAPWPFRPRKAEETLRGARWDDLAAVEAAAVAASQEATPRDSLLRGSAAYRLELVRVLVRRVLKVALEQAAATRGA
ncbi:MAG: FAD binding domain-containing protein [Chloroflexota bacterium]|nr:FAD binding domain-containing protein [Chloroflexota bacterium]